MHKKANSVDKNSAEYWAKIIAGGRASLLLIVVLTVVNIVLLLIEADRYFVFSASIPYYLTAICMGMDSAVYGGIDAYTTGALIVSVIVVGIYLLCWALGKKKTGWLITALVLFSLNSGTFTYHIHPAGGSDPQSHGHFFPCLGSIRAGNGSDLRGKAQAAGSRRDLRHDFGYYLLTAKG
ncbi:MAG: hypothetical protein V8S87_01705 [Oscillospiraceae bacterium]